MTRTTTPVKKKTKTVTKRKNAAGNTVTRKTTSTKVNRKAKVGGTSVGRKVSKTKFKETERTPSGKKVGSGVTVSKNGKTKKMVSKGPSGKAVYYKRGKKMM